MNARKLSIYIVEDHPAMREAYSMVLESEMDMAICGMIDRVTGALDGIRAAGPDVVLVDVFLPDGDGIELVSEIRSHFPTMGILVVSGHASFQYAERALKAGAGAYLDKREAAQTLAHKIRSVSGDGFDKSNNDGTSYRQGRLPFD